MIRSLPQRFEDVAFRVDSNCGACNHHRATAWVREDVHVDTHTQRGREKERTKCLSNSLSLWNESSDSYCYKILLL